MTLTHYLFGLSGRINRAKQWAVLLVKLVQAILVGIVFAGTIGFAAVADVFQHRTTFADLWTTPQAHAFAVIFCGLTAIGFYIGIAVAIKRLHDRNKSAWWILIFYVLPFALSLPALLEMPQVLAHAGEAMRAARDHLLLPTQMIEPVPVRIMRGVGMIISLWAFIELFCLRGTKGDNRFGTDPLA
jgi:uncharacterized membrane protein YhaH (DUF805 family)